MEFFEIGDAVYGAMPYKDFDSLGQQVLYGTPSSNTHVDVTTRAPIGERKPILFDPTRMGRLASHMVKYSSYNRTGCDPEIFFESKDGIVPAWEILPKKGPGITHFWDGFQGEFTVTPSHCHDQVTTAIRAQLKRVHAILGKKGKLSTKSVLPIPPSLFETAGEEHIALGCKPSENVYGIIGQPVVDGRLLPWRFAGGHIHFGAERLQIPDVRQRAVRALDSILAVWGVGVAASFDNPIRRKFYGLPGEHRAPKHGLEYRTLSNFWIIAPQLVHATLDLARGVARSAIEGITDAWRADIPEVIDVVTACDVKRAREVLTRNKDFFLHLAMAGTSAINARAAAAASFKMAQNGLESVISDPENFEENWAFRIDDYEYNAGKFSWYRWGTAKWVKQ